MGHPTAIDIRRIYRDDAAMSKPLPICEQLGVGPDSVTFVNVQPGVDTKLFLDPFRLMHAPSDQFYDSLRAGTASFFKAMVELVAYSIPLAELLSHGREPLYTHLGLAQAGNVGRGLGDTTCRTFSDAAVGFINRTLSQESSPLTGLEDLCMLVPNVGKDRVSDLITNIISFQLAEYTAQCMASFPGKLRSTMVSLWGWRPGGWEQKRTPVALVAGRPVLLVPKRICGAEPLWNTEAMLLELISLVLRNRDRPSGHRALSYFRLNKGDARYSTAETVLAHLRKMRRAVPSPQVQTAFSIKEAMFDIASLAPDLYGQVKRMPRPEPEPRVVTRWPKPVVKTFYNLRQE